MAAGHGGQILVAATTAALVDGVELVDLGEHRLRDLSGARRLFQVLGEGLRDGFPAVRTLDDIPGILGRERFDECVATGAAMDRAEAIRYERAQIRTARDELGVEP